MKLTAENAEDAKKTGESPLGHAYVEVVRHQQAGEHPPASACRHGTEPLEPLDAVLVVADDLPPLQPRLVT